MQRALGSGHRRGRATSHPDGAHLTSANRQPGPIMKITEFSLRNPLVIAAVTVAIAVFGLFSYLSMGVAITPNVNFPQVVVTTVYPGADPETVESGVTKPIEDAIA